ncbi:hypothetical protein LCGC14_2974480 [marine sediment metagenome]|uniref:Uncharacterized protein n=1 Tax=marine sediment metagenome TaxID=412755 RepID=A0A0F8X9D7_9ZZZZ
MKKWGKPIVLALMLLMTGCSGTTGTMIATLFGAGATLGGQALLSRGAEDVEAKVLWRAQKRDYVREYTDGLLAEARSLRNRAEFEGWRGVMDILIEFHEGQRPETLAMELKRRLEPDE